MQVLRELGFMQIDSSMLPDASPPQLLPEFENYPAFSMHAYPDEPAATGPYVKYLQVNHLSMFAAISVT